MLPIRLTSGVVKITKKRGALNQKGMVFFRGPRKRCCDIGYDPFKGGPNIVLFHGLTYPGLRSYTCCTFHTFLTAVLLHRGFLPNETAVLVFFEIDHPNSFLASSLITVTTFQGVTLCWNVLPVDGVNQPGPAPQSWINASEENILTPSRL